MNTKAEIVKVKTTKKLRKYRVQDLVDEDRVLVSGRHYNSTNGDRAKYIADRLQALLELTPSESTALRYSNFKGNIKSYRYEDCKYDLNQVYPELASKSSEVGRSSVHVAEWLTPNRGTLTEVVTKKLGVISRETEGNGTQKHMKRVRRRNIDGGETAGNLLGCRDRSQTARQRSLCLEIKVKY